MRASERETYLVTLRPLPGVDGVRALRGALKVLGRRFGLRVTSIREQHTDYDLSDRAKRPIFPDHDAKRVSALAEMPPVIAGRAR